MEIDKRKKVTMQTLLSILIMAIGLLLMVFKIYADSEPGAIPLLLIIVGGGWFFVTRFLLRRRQIE